MEQEQQKRYRAWAEIDLNALTHNVQTVQKLLPAQTQYMAVVKANAYGHGDEAICRKLWELGVRWFAVSNLEEALSVRQFCPYGEIFILGYTPPEFAPELARNNIIQGVLSMEYARQLQHFAHQPVRCHIKLDTGMGRIGFRGDSPRRCCPCLTWKSCLSRAFTPISLWQILPRQTMWHIPRRRRTASLPFMTNWQSWGIR